MEVKDKMNKEEIQKELNPSLPKPDPDQSSNQNIYAQYQKEKEIKKEEQENMPQESSQKETKEDIKQNEEISNGIKNSQKNDSNNMNSVQKTKRRRRGKDEIMDRNYRCPDCDKCYLSGPALTTHRKTKHGYGTEGEKRNRGRPKKDGQSDNMPITPLDKFNNFFKDENRKPDESLNDKIITTEIIKKYMENIFNQCKNDLFQNLENVGKYSFYSLVVENWDKENPFLEKECYRAMQKKDEPLIKIKSFTLDELFFMYLKEFAYKTNKDYFWFIIKFIVLFRECINLLRANFVQNNDDTSKRWYSQIYNAETVPEICNDFFMDFMGPHNFFGMLKTELIELIQHFCYWLFSKQYTQSHLTLLDG